MSKRKNGWRAMTDFPSENVAPALFFQQSLKSMVARKAHCSSRDFDEAICNLYKALAVKNGRTQEGTKKADLRDNGVQVVLEPPDAVTPVTRRIGYKENSETSGSDTSDTCFASLPDSGENCCRNHPNIICCGDRKRSDISIDCIPRAVCLKLPDGSDGIWMRSDCYPYNNSCLLLTDKPDPLLHDKPNPCTITIKEIDDNDEQCSDNRAVKRSKNHKFKRSLLFNTNYFNGDSSSVWRNTHRSSIPKCKNRSSRAMKSAASNTAAGNNRATETKNPKPRIDGCTQFNSCTGPNKPRSWPAFYRKMKSNLPIFNQKSLITKLSETWWANFLYNCLALLIQVVGCYYCSVLSYVKFW